jgi:hypothetical protein
MSICKPIVNFIGFTEYVVKNQMWRARLPPSNKISSIVKESIIINRVRRKHHIPEKYGPTGGDHATTGYSGQN